MEKIIILTLFWKWAYLSSLNYFCSFGSDVPEIIRTLYAKEKYTCPKDRKVTLNTNQISNQKYSISNEWWTAVKDSALQTLTWNSKIVQCNNILHHWYGWDI